LRDDAELNARRRVTAVRIELENLTGAEQDFAHQYGANELEFVDERIRLIEPPEISGRLSRHNRQVVLTGSIRARIEVDCDRCLQPVQLPVAADFHLKYAPASECQNTANVELEIEDMELSIFAGDVIDIDEIVREQILLAVPERVLCRADCQGICPVCGGDLNLKNCGCAAQEIDPRWAALKNLQS
jgi:uncharacterized protein